MKKLTPELLVDDFEKSLEFYQDVFGFEATVVFPEEEPFFAIIKNGDVEVMLYGREAFAEEIPKFKSAPMGGTVALYINVEEVKGLIEQVQDRVTIIQDLHETAYGTLEFSCEDLNGYVLMFAETL